MQLPKMLALAVTATTVAACGATANLQDRPGGPGDDVTRVEVTNDNWSDIRVYAERDGQRVRLGSVTTMRTEVFRLPADLLQGSGSIRLIADPIGAGERHVTHRILIWPGQTVRYNVANHIGVSHAFVR
jgi:hypothetical protein